MICEECRTQFKSEGIRLSLYGLCSNCGMKLRFHHALVGYWYGIFGSAAPLFILMLAPNSGPMFMATVILGPTVTFILFYAVIKALGKSSYRTVSEFERWRFVKVIAGTSIGFSSLLGWFLIGIKYWG